MVLLMETKRVNKYKVRVNCKVYSHIQEYKGRTSVHLDLNIPRKSFQPRADRGEWEIKPQRSNKNTIHLVVKNRPNNFYGREREIQNEAQIQQLIDVWRRKLDEGYSVFVKYHKYGKKNSNQASGDVV